MVSHLPCPSCRQPLWLRGYQGRHEDARKLEAELAALCAIVRQETPHLADCWKPNACNCDRQERIEQEIARRWVARQEKTE